MRDDKAEARGGGEQRARRGITRGERREKNEREQGRRMRMRREEKRERRNNRSREGWGKNGQGRDE